MPGAPREYTGAFERGAFDQAAAALWRIIADLSRQIEDARPWELLKRNDLAPLKAHLHRWLTELHRLAYWLEPLLPTASKRILDVLAQSPLTAAAPLFPRLNR